MSLPTELHNMLSREIRELNTHGACTNDLACLIRYLRMQKSKYEFDIDDYIREKVWPFLLGGVIKKISSASDEEYYNFLKIQKLGLELPPEMFVWVRDAIFNKLTHRGYNPKDYIVFNLPYSMSRKDSSPLSKEEHKCLYVLIVPNISVDGVWVYSLK
jgi:hypothetical protein